MANETAAMGVPTPGDPPLRSSSAAHQLLADLAGLQLRHLAVPIAFLADRGLAMAADAPRDVVAVDGDALVELRDAGLVTVEPHPKWPGKGRVIRVTNAGLEALDYS